MKLHAFFLTAAVILLISVAVTSGTAQTGDSTDKPFVSASLSAATVSAGNPEVITGIASGSSVKNVQVWIFSDTFAKEVRVPVGSDASFTYTIDTTGFSPGTYYVIIQDPVDTEFAISYEPKSGSVVNTALSTNLFSYIKDGKPAMNGSETAAALTNALNGASVNDVYTKLTFTVTAPPAATETKVVPSTTAAPATVQTSVSPEGTTAPAGTAEPVTAAATTTTVPPTKSPASLMSAVLGIALGCCVILLCRRTR